MNTARLPLIDEKGNIFLHGQEDLQIIINFGAENVANRVMFFITERGTRISVPNDPENPGIRKIMVPKAEIAKIPPNGTNYALRDETEFPDFVRMDGTIRWYGWV